MKKQIHFVFKILFFNLILIFSCTSKTSNQNSAEAPAFKVSNSEILGLRISGQELYNQFCLYDSFSVVVDLSAEPDTMKIYGIENGQSTEITKYFEHTKTYKIGTYNTSPLLCLGKNHRPPNPAVVYYYLDPKQVRKTIWFKRYLSIKINRTDDINSSNLKSINPCPPGIPGYTIE